MPQHDSVLMLVNVVRAIILLLLISFSDLLSSVIKLPSYIIIIMILFVQLFYIQIQIQILFI